MDRIVPTEQLRKGLPSRPRQSFASFWSTKIHKLAAAYSGAFRDFQPPAPYPEASFDGPGFERAGAVFRSEAEKKAGSSFVPAF